MWSEMRSHSEKIKQFCLIQLEILKDRQERLRKEIFNCEIQREFLTDTVKKLDDDD